MPVTAEGLFLTHFLPLYPADARDDLARARTVDANPGQNPAILAHLEEAARIFAARAPALLELSDDELRLDFSDASVHRLSAALTPSRRDRWLERGEPGTADNELFNLVVHGAAYVGVCILHDSRRRARWAVRRPLWESVIELASPAGEAHLAIFQWWLKSLSDDALAPSSETASPTVYAGTLADRYRTHVEVPTSRVDLLPPIAPKDRRLPRIAKVRYDVLYKHLKAHLPELRDLGSDFPRAERFADMGLKWLDFLLLGEGGADNPARMLLMYGPGEGGLHLIWLDLGGFHKASFIPADAFPEPIVKLEGDQLVAIVSWEGKPVAHHMLWWGP
ncbi:hypothetical protein [Pendulispora albinea]|uniref:Uncharacterized protein n=1 Tax=Pendulispora albinea TaxID=2741071 RepID=A0ABZ2LZQ2_9BACT